MYAEKLVQIVCFNACHFTEDELIKIENLLK